MKKRREQRELEREQMAEELEMIQRERALAEAVELEKKEEEFHLEQARTRVEQRLTEGRPKPVDLLAAAILGLDVGDGEDQARGLGRGGWGGAASRGARRRCLREPPRPFRPAPLPLPCPVSPPRSWSPTL